jgi:recombinational DNA repair ATPase RecF
MSRTGPTRRRVYLTDSAVRTSNQSASIIPVVLVIPNIGMYGVFGVMRHDRRAYLDLSQFAERDAPYAAASDGPDNSDAPVAGSIGRVYG